MYFKVSYDDDFDELMLYLKSKYGDKLFTLDGIGKQLDMNQFSKEFFANTTTTADVSVDSNANIDTRDIITYNFELPKPFMRYNSYYLLWKKLKQLYGHVESNRIVERQINGDIYINDFNDIARPYCFNFSTYDVMLEGLCMINKIKSVKPKFLYSFKSQIEQFVLIASNSTLGATGLADFLLVMSYYVKNALETLSDAHFKFQTQEDVWNYVRETIISFIYTVNQPMRGHQAPFTNISIFDDYFIDDLSQYYFFPDESKPDKELVKKLQELYIDIVNEELERTPITFPITTACISIDEDGNIKDDEFVKFIAEKNKKFGFMNIYCGSSSTLSSCCFSGEQKVLTKSSDGVHYEKFSDHKYRHNQTIFHNGSWCQGKVVKIDKLDKKMFKIVTSNNKELLVTEDHIHPTLEGDKPTIELTDNDYLMFNNLPVDSYPEKDMNLTYNQGMIVGLYLGGEHSDKSYSFVREWVSDDEKKLNLDCLLQSIEFRQGIIDGFYHSGGFCNEETIEQIEVLITSLGKQSIIDFGIKLCGASIVKNNSTFFKIKTIEEIDITDDKVYCFEMKNEPYFTLPNGIITHNCRLRSDNTNEYFNSFGSGSSKIGSLGVVTINLPRIAYKNKNSADEFLYDLEELVYDVGKINNSKRNIIKRRTDNGSLPLYNLGFMDLNKQYSTVGITGLNEACEIMGFDILESDGQNFVLSILDIINRTNDKLQKKYKAPHNCEQVPAENSSIKLAKKDVYMGYKNGEYEIYSNQFIPLTTNADLLDRIKLQGLFDKHFSGGAICHLNIENKIEDTQKMIDLIRMSARMGVVYFAVNYNLQYCKNNHMSVGNNTHCSICGEEIIGNYTRVVGFLTNVKNWHKVRREKDYPDRKFYKEL